MDYIILSATDARELEPLVIAKMREDYIPTGGVVIHTKQTIRTDTRSTGISHEVNKITIAQAMYKITKESI